MEAFVAKAAERARSSRAERTAKPASHGTGGPQTDIIASGLGDRHMDNEYNFNLLKRFGEVPIEVVLPGLAVLDAVSRPNASWADIGESRSAWIARIALMPILGPWSYSVSVKPRLDAAVAANRLRGG